MELRHLRYFVAVAEELHFGRAAMRLHISQPPLSQQIRALEQESGVALFARIGRGVELTPAGKEFLHYARTALSQVQQGVRSAQRVQQGQLGSLNVGFITSMAYTYLPWVVREFRSQFPEVELVLTEQETSAQVRALLENRLQVGILRGPIDDAQLSSTVALTERFVVVLPDSHRFASSPRVKLSDLAEDSFIMFPRSIGGPFFEAVASLFRDAGFAPRVSQEAVQMHVAVGLVSARLGVALVPASTQLLTSPGATFKPLSGEGGRVEISIVHPVREESPMVAAFSDVARRVIGKGIQGIRRRRNP